MWEVTTRGLWSNLLLTSKFERVAKCLALAKSIWYPSAAAVKACYLNLSVSWLRDCLSDCGSAGCLGITSAGTLVCPVPSSSPADLVLLPVHVKSLQTAALGLLRTQRGFQKCIHRLLLGGKEKP